MSLKKTVALGLVVAISAAVAGRARAGDISWVGGATPSYSDKDNWGGGVPTATDSAVFAALDALTHGVDVTGDAVVGEVWVEAGMWAFTVDGGNTWTSLGTFNFAGGTAVQATVGGAGNYVVDQTRFNAPLGTGGAVSCVVSFNGANWDSRGTGADGSGLFDVGLAGGGASVAIGGGSQVTADYFRVGENGGSWGRMVVSGTGTHLTGLSGMQVGATGYGELVVEGEALADLANLTLGNFRDEKIGPGVGNATISGEGTELNVLEAAASGDHAGGNGWLTLGDDGQGYMAVNHGATVNATRLVVANSWLAEGNLTVENATTSFHVMGDAVIGAQGRGTLTVRDGAVFQAGNLEVGREGAGRVVIDGATAQIYDTMWVGAYGSGALALQGAARLSTANLVVGQYSEGTGTIEVTGGGTELQVTSDAFLIGSGGGGTLNIAGGGRVTAVDHVIAWFDQDGNQVDEEVEGGHAAWASAWLIVGDQLEAAGTITVGGAGSVLEVQNAPMTVGGNGTGVLRVTDQGSVAITKGDLRIGEAAGSGGLVEISGAGSQLSALGANASKVGRWGAGTLTITAGGAGSFTHLFVGDENGSQGIVDVSGENSSLTVVDSLRVGNAGTGQLIVAGRAILDTANLEIGRSGTGTATVTGAGTELRVTSGQFNVGVGGTGTLVITDGGRATAVDHVVGWYDSTGNPVDGPGDGATPAWSSAWVVVGGEKTGSGTILVSGSGSTLDVQHAPLMVGENGTGVLQVTDRGLVTIGNGELWIGLEAGSRGTVEIRGAGSHLEEASGYSSEVGTRGQGSLAIGQGGKASLSYLTVGVENGGKGVVEVSGAESALTTTGLVVGNVGTGTLAASDGAALATADLRVGQGNGTDKGNGTVSVTGATLTVDDPNHEEGNLWIGYMGTGLLEVVSGAVVSAPAGNLFVGGFTGSAGEVTVNGKGSQILALQDGYGSWVGREGVGRLTISNEGYVKVSRMTVGERPGGAGYVTVTSGAVLEVAHDIRLGVAGTGEMHLEGGVVVLGDQSLVVAAQGKLWGTGTVCGGVLNEGGVVTPGDTGDLLTVNYFGQKTGGLLVFALAGHERGISYDAMDVLALDGAMGNVDLFGGTLRVTLAEGHNPAAGDTYDLIAAANPILVWPELTMECVGLAAGLGYEFGVAHDGATGMNVMRLSVIEEVPEPASLAVLGLGLGVLLGRRRR
jgi:T5SS/PEP-CTERM-associated repeat protein